MQMSRGRVPGGAVGARGWGKAGRRRTVHASAPRRLPYIFIVFITQRPPAAAAAARVMSCPERR